MAKRHKKPMVLRVQAPKSRDLVHLGEITHGSGAGAHQTKRRPNTRTNQTRKWLKETGDTRFPLLLRAI